jgi:RNA polymerase sigma-70 factor, ECF subfamily
MEQAQDLARLFRLVNELPEDQRNVVVMRFAEEKSIREAAQQLGRSEGAVKQLQFRGLENLRVRLKSGAAEPRTAQKNTKERHTKQGKTTGVENG